MSEQAAAAIITCDYPGCDAEATHSYAWEWGEKGVRCGTHAPLLQQTAAQIGRTVAISTLNLPGPEPLLRDERTRLVANGLVLEAELEEAKARGLELYRINDQLRGQNHLLTVREAEAHAQLKDAQALVERLRSELGSREAELANLVMETERLRTLAAFTPRGEDEETRVD